VTREELFANIVASDSRLGVRLIVLIPVTVFYRPVPPKCPCVQLFCQDSPPDPSCILRKGRRRQGLVAKNRTQGNSQDALFAKREDKRGHAQYDPKERIRKEKSAGAARTFKCQSKKCTNRVFYSNAII